MQTAVLYERERVLPQDRVAAPGRGAWPEAERRAFRRRRCYVEVSCRALEDWRDTAPWPAVLLDVSAAGVGVLSARPAGKGELLSVRLPATGGSPPSSFVCRVVHASSRPAGLWLLGCALTDRADWDGHRTHEDGPAVTPEAPPFTRLADREALAGLTPGRE
jgi:hypothetical protein